MDDYSSSFPTIPSKSESPNFFPYQNSNNENQVTLEDQFNRLQISVSSPAYTPPPLDQISKAYGCGFHIGQTSDQGRMGIGTGLNTNNPIMSNHAFVSPYHVFTRDNTLIGADIDNRNNMLLNGYPNSISHLSLDYELLMRQRQPFNSYLRGGASYNRDSEQNFGLGFVNQHPFVKSVPIVNSNNVNGWRGSQFDNSSGRVLAMAMDPYRSRGLQDLMKSSRTDWVSFIFSELKDHVKELAIDSSGNYVVQKMAEVCNVEQRTMIIQNITDHPMIFFRMCLCQYGSRAVEKLLEHVTTSEQRTLVMSALNHTAKINLEELKDNCVVHSPCATILCKDINGHRIVLYCLKHFTHEDTKIFLHEVAINAYDIAKDKTGCCVLQQCVDHSYGETRTMLIENIIANASRLAENCYGNYVVQHLLSLKISGITNGLLSKLQTKFVNLSCNKYGSNVVEKFFQDSGELQSQFIIIELLRNPQVERLLVDPFGNYVIQSAMSISKRFGDERCSYALGQLIKNNSEMMRNNLYGKKLLNRFDKERTRRM